MPFDATIFSTFPSPFYAWAILFSAEPERKEREHSKTTIIMDLLSIIEKV